MVGVKVGVLARASAGGGGGGEKGGNCSGIGAGGGDGALSELGKAVVSVCAVLFVFCGSLRVGGGRGQLMAGRRRRPLHRGPFHTQVVLQTVQLEVYNE